MTASPGSFGALAHKSLIVSARMLLRASLFSIAVVLLASCASAPSPRGPQAPRSAPVGPAPTTIDDAQKDIAHWREVLGLPATEASGSAGVTTPAPTSTAVAPGTSDVANTNPPPPPMTTPSQKNDTPADATSSNVDPCENGCRAIASMRRSVGVLCQLAGDDDPRCVDAKKSLEESEARVARCGC
jgi:hypothetical protein